MFTITITRHHLSFNIVFSQEYNKMIQNDSNSSSFFKSLINHSSAIIIGVVSLRKNTLFSECVVCSTNLVNQACSIKTTLLKESLQSDIVFVFHSFFFSFNKSLLSFIYPVLLEIKKFNFILKNLIKQSLQRSIVYF